MNPSVTPTAQEASIFPGCVQRLRTRHLKVQKQCFIIARELSLSTAAGKKTGRRGPS
jgi:hypothetical protein